MVDMIRIWEEELKKVEEEEERSGITSWAKDYIKNQLKEAREKVEVSAS